MAEKHSLTSLYVGYPPKVSVHVRIIVNFTADMIFFSSKPYVNHYTTCAKITMLYTGEVGKPSLRIDRDRQRMHSGYDICGKALRIHIKIR